MSVAPPWSVASQFQITIGGVGMPKVHAALEVQLAIPALIAFLLLLAI